MQTRSMSKREREEGVSQSKRVKLSAAAMILANASVNFIDFTDKLYNAAPTEDAKMEILNNSPGARGLFDNEINQNLPSQLRYAIPDHINEVLPMYNYVNLNVVNGLNKMQNIAFNAYTRCFSGIERPLTMEQAARCEIGGVNKGLILLGEKDLLKVDEVVGNEVAIEVAKQRLANKIEEAAAKEKLNQEAEEKNKEKVSELYITYTKLCQELGSPAAALVGKNVGVNLTWLTEKIEELTQKKEAIKKQAKKEALKLENDLKTIEEEIGNLKKGINAKSDDVAKYLKEKPLSTEEVTGRSKEDLDKLNEIKEELQEYESKLSGRILEQKKIVWEGWNNKFIYEYDMYKRKKEQFIDFVKKSSEKYPELLNYPKQFQEFTFDCDLKENVDFEARYNELYGKMVQETREIEKEMTKLTTYKSYLNRVASLNKLRNELNGIIEIPLSSELEKTIAEATLEEVDMVLNEHVILQQKTEKAMQVKTSELNKAIKVEQERRSELFKRFRKFNPKADFDLFVKKYNYDLGLINKFNPVVTAKNTLDLLIKYNDQYNQEISDIALKTIPIQQYLYELDQLRILDPIQAFTELESDEEKLRTFKKDDLENLVKKIRDEKTKLFKAKVEEYLSEYENIESNLKLIHEEMNSKSPFVKSRFPEKISLENIKDIESLIASLKIKLGEEQSKLKLYQNKLEEEKEIDNQLIEDEFKKWYREKIKDLNFYENALSEPVREKFTLEIRWKEFKTLEEKREFLKKLNEEFEAFRLQYQLEMDNLNERLLEVIETSKNAELSDIGTRQQNLNLIKSIGQKQKFLEAWENYANEKLARLQKEKQTKLAFKLVAGVIGTFVAAQLEKRREEARKEAERLAIEEQQRKLEEDERKRKEEKEREEEETRRREEEDKEREDQFNASLNAIAAFFAERELKKKEEKERKARAAREAAEEASRKEFERVYPTRVRSYMTDTNGSSLEVMQQFLFSFGKSKVETPYKEGGLVRATKENVNYFKSQRNACINYLNTQFKEYMGMRGVDAFVYQMKEALLEEPEVGRLVPRNYQNVMLILQKELQSIRSNPPIGSTPQAKKM